MNWKRFLLCSLGACLLVIQGVVAAAPVERLIFVQNDQGKRTVSLYQPEDGKQVSILSGSKMAVFLQNKHLYYFMDHQLFEYNLTRGKAKLLYKFKEDWIQMKVIAEGNGLNQLLIVATTARDTNWYIMDVDDASLRRIDQPPYIPANNLTAINTMSNSNEKYTVSVKRSPFKGRINLVVQEKKALKSKIIWELPGELSVLPDLINWSPDGNTLLFYAKSADGYQGFYALYALNPGQLKLQMVSDSVLYYDLLTSSGLSEFLPSWSADSQYVVFQSQPTGSPAKSILLKYDFKSGKIITLAQSSGQNQYPRIAPSGNWIAFVSNREQVGRQLYIVDRNGAGMKRVSGAGVTEWVEWVD